jgi:hypothetical protein
VGQQHHGLPGGVPPKPTADHIGLVVVVKVVVVVVVVVKVVVVVLPSDGKHGGWRNVRGAR